MLYSAPKKEITALALDHAGNIYAAAVGEKRSSGGPGGGALAAALLNLGANPPTAAPPPKLQASRSRPPLARRSWQVRFHSRAVGPAAAPMYTASRRMVRLQESGRRTKTSSMPWRLIRKGRLLAGTGNRGHIFAITGQDDFSDLLKAPASQVTGFAKAPGGGLYAATSNLGKVFVLGPGPEAEGTYESDVFDAKIFSRWGRAEFRGTGSVDLYARSGNVDNPDRNWSPWKKIDLATNSETGIPAARYAQWKAVLHAGTVAPGVDSVALNYLPKNVAPEIDDVTVQVGVKYQPMPKTSGSTWARIPADPPSADRLLPDRASISKPRRPARTIATRLE